MELIPAPFARLLRRMLREFEREGKVFDLPARRFWHGDPALDTAVRFHARSVAASAMSRSRERRSSSVSGVPSFSLPVRIASSSSSCPRAREASAEPAKKPGPIRVR